MALTLSFMKRHLLLFTLCFVFCHSLSAQNRILYSHDAAGNRILRQLGNNQGGWEWLYPENTFISYNSTLKIDGPLGYANEIYNAGILHINPNVFTNGFNPLWDEWNKKWLFYYLLPKRFQQKTVVRLY